MVKKTYPKPSVLPNPNPTWERAKDRILSEVDLTDIEGSGVNTRGMTAYFHRDLTVPVVIKGGDMARKMHLHILTYANRILGISGGENGTT